MPGAGFAEPRAGLSGAPDSVESLAGRQVALIDLLDRLLNGGAVLTGDLVLSVADVDLVHINLRAVIRSITSDEPAPW
ncbi:gas vesicle protein [Streptomyces sp. ALB3]|uniref:gas vesicle protein n=1 Tax=Streptomyces sp. ALB3 TaxID=3374278 RepID=UPI00378B9B4A